MYINITKQKITRLKGAKNEFVRIFYEKIGLCERRKSC